MTKPMKTKAYTIQSQGLQFIEDLDISVKFKTGVTVACTLGSLSAEVKAQGLSDAYIAHAHVGEAKTGVFATVGLKTRLASLAAYRVKGVDVEPGDGLCFTTQGQARSFVKELMKLGVELDELACQWMVGKAQVPIDQLPTNPAPKAADPSDAPWNI